MLLKNESSHLSSADSEASSARNNHSSDNQFQSTSLGSPPSSSSNSSPASSSASTSASGSPTPPRSVEARSSTRGALADDKSAAASPSSSAHQLLKSVSQQFRQSVGETTTMALAEAEPRGAATSANQGESSASGSPTSLASSAAATKDGLNNNNNLKPMEANSGGREGPISSSESQVVVSRGVLRGERPDCVTIIHFNDCYNIEPNVKSSGAAGFLTAVNQFRHLEPLILFSGDILSPSFMSTFTKGEQMIPVLNDIGVHCAVFGNHEFDYGVDNLINFTRRTTFPWLLSNVIDKETSNQLGDGLVYHTLERAGIKFGLIGLIEEEWLSTLSTLELDDVVYTDYVERGRELARWLKGPAHGVDFVIALTHFRTPNDIRLADSVPEIDLILGGHDHDYEIIERPNCHIIKSGTDFREFSLIKLKLNGQYNNNNKRQQAPPASGQERNATRETMPPARAKPFGAMHIERIDCAAYPPEPNLKAKLDKFVSTIDEKMGQVLGQFNCELDGRFASIRKYETNLGNFVTDIMLASTHADLAILNSGTLRSDRVHPRGDFTMRDLFNILGYIDPIAVLQASGRQILRALENGVSQWPKLEGRFPQVSGCSFAFNPSKPPLKRIDARDVLIGEEPLALDKQYKLTTKAYLASGKDGYDVLKDCLVLVPGDESPDLTTSILNHFEAINIIKSNRRTHHRQSIICLSRSSIKKILDQTSGPLEHSPASVGPLLSSAAALSDGNNNNNNNSDFANIDEEPAAAAAMTMTTMTALNGKVPDGRVDSGAVIMRGGGASDLNSVKCQQHCCSEPAAAAAAAPATRALSNSARPPPDARAAPLERSAPADCLPGSQATLGHQPRQARTKRVMSLYEMEHEQCKLEPKVEGRIKIYGVNC